MKLVAENFESEPVWPAGFHLFYLGDFVGGGNCRWYAHPNQL
jgi:hypothetical protein